MTFQQLRYLLEVYRTGSVSQAAANLFVTRPSVSFSISSLENELGYPIFIRTQQGLIPSSRGKLVLEYASRICETHRLITNIGSDKRNNIVIATLNHPPVNAAVIRLLEENAGRSDIRFTFKTSGAKFDKVAFFEIDAALSTAFEAADDRGEQLARRDLHWRELQKIPVYFCIGPGHRLYSKEKIVPSDFDNEVLLDTGSMALSRSKYFNKIIKINPETVICCNIPTQSNDIIAKGLAYTIRKHPSKELMQAYGFRCIPLEGVYQSLLCVHNPLRPLAPEVIRFLELLEEELAAYRGDAPLLPIPAE